MNIVPEENKHILKVSNKFIFPINVILILYICNGVYSQTTVTDTIFSIYNLDGGICYLYENDDYFIVPHTVSGGPGDGYNFVFWAWQYCHNYYSFNLSFLPVDTIGFELLSADFHLFQYASYGNDERGVYPIWDFPGGDTNYCYLDHIDYGYQLDSGDWTAGDPGDSQTLYPLYTIVTSTPDTGFRYIDITELVLDDIANNRQKSQFRIHFPIGTDFDRYTDGVGFSAIDYPLLYRRPKLIVEYRISNVGIANQSTTIPTDLNINNAYPNPFNAKVSIEYEINKPGLFTLAIFDLAGRKIRVLISDFYPIGQYYVQWDGKNQSRVDVPSGVYFIKLEGNMNSVGRKVILLR